MKRLTKWLCSLCLVDPIDRDFEGSVMADNLAHPYNSVVTIDMLPDDVLLAIFDFYVHGHQVQFRSYFVVRYYDSDLKRGVESWQSLIHVCRRWRGLVFGSPRRLNLQLCCTPQNAQISLDIWPALPLLIMSDGDRTSGDDIVPKLKHGNRIFQIDLVFSTIEQFKNVWPSMQVPFPELEALYLSNDVFVSIDMVPVLPDSFLGGSAPRLRILSFDAISFLGLPNLLLSATRLVNLSLFRIPHSGYISPEAMVTCLSMLTSLEALSLEFESPESSPDQENRRSPPPTRSILPALNIFDFKGVNEYLEDLVSWIDSPRLCQLRIKFFNDIDFDTPELNQFLIRTPSLGAYDEAHVIFHHHKALASLQIQPSRHRWVEVTILSQMSNWQLSSLTQICTLSLRFFLTTENLYIYENPYLPPNWKDDIESTEWLDLLHPFTAVKNLYLFKDFLPRIARALQESHGARATEVFPTLKNVFLEGFQPSEPVQEGIAQFISARQLTDHPVEISVWHITKHPLFDTVYL